MIESVGAIKLLLTKFWYHGVFIFLGAAFYATLFNNTEKDKGQPHGWRVFLVAMFVGGFSGLMFALAASSFFSIEEGQLAFVGGLGAVLGLNGVKILKETFIAGVRRKLDDYDRRD